MQKHFRIATALSFVLAVSAPAPNSFARSDAKAEHIITSEEQNDISKESVLKMDGLMREHVAKITVHCKTPMEVAKAIYDDIRSYGEEGKLTKAGITANAQRTFYLRRGYCSARSYLFIAMFNERMKALGLKAEAHPCEIYRNSNAFRTIPHMAVAVVEGDYTVIFDPTLNKIIDRRVKPIAARTLGVDGVLSNYYINLAAVADTNKDHVAAERLARAAVRLEPKSAFAHYILAEYLVENGKLEEAKKEAEATVKLAPVWPNGYETLEDVLIKLGLKREADNVWGMKRKVLSRESFNIDEFLKEMGYKPK